MTCTALMKRPCVALVPTVRRVRRLRRVYQAVRVAGHHFKRELDWRCENCGAKLDPRRRPGVGFGVPPEDYFEPCPKPTLSRFEEIFFMVMLGILDAQTEPEEQN